MPLSGQNTLKDKTSFAFQRVLDAGQELKKVIDRAPDARKEVGDVASYLFQSGDLDKVFNNFDTLTKRAAIAKTSDKHNDNTQDDISGQPSYVLDVDEIVGFLPFERRLSLHESCN
jgi:hypothetical protein